MHKIAGCDREIHEWIAQILGSEAPRAFLRYFIHWPQCGAIISRNSRLAEC